MTANGEIEPQASTSFVKLKSSVYLLGNYEIKPSGPCELCRENVSFLLKSTSAINGDMRLTLSFKHIVRVDFADNRDEKGAAIVLYFNDFMAKKLDKLLTLEPLQFSKFRNIHDKHAFMVFDILNCNKETMDNVWNVLNEAEKFHCEYIRKRIEDEGKKDQEMSNPNQKIIRELNSEHYKKLLNALHKELYLEEVTLQAEEKSEKITYVSGRIVTAIIPTQKCTIERDGRIVQIGTGESNILGRNKMPEQSRTYALTKMPVTESPASKKARLMYTKRQLPLTPRYQAVNAIHTIDDDSVMAGSTQTQNNSVVAVYETKSGARYTLHESDVKTLQPTELVNDTVIDFYLSYILNDMLDTEKRDQIYLFNSFFYTKLSKGVHESRNTKLRSKKIQENYATLKSWTKSVNLFSKNYIVVPICEETHWYIAVVVCPSLGFVNKTDNATASSPDASMDSLTNTTGSSESPTPSTINLPAIPVFIFDSLLDVNDLKRQKLVADLLLEYLQLEFRDKKVEHDLPGVAYRKTTARVVIPSDTPQQRNPYDCGIFMLQFAESFLNRLPTVDELTNSVTYEQLFGAIDLNGKRENILKLITEVLPSTQTS